MACSFCSCLGTPNYLKRTDLLVRSLYFLTIKGGLICVLNSLVIWRWWSNLTTILQQRWPSTHLVVVLSTTCGSVLWGCIPVTLWNHQKTAGISQQSCRSRGNSHWIQVHLCLPSFNVLFGHLYILYAFIRYSKWRYLWQYSRHGCGMSTVSFRVVLLSWVQLCLHLSFFHPQLETPHNLTQSTHINKPILLLILLYGLRCPNWPTCVWCW